MNDIYDIIIIGAGPAGLTAAIYGRRANKNILVLEAITYGGRIINAKEIENYPGVKKVSGFEYATNLYEQAKYLGTKILYERVEGVIDQNDTKKVITNKGEYTSKAVIIANGINNKKLDLPNEKEFTGKGISYCATCDGNFFKGKDVCVYGGGLTAIEDCLYLSDLCNKVILIYRGNNIVYEDKLKEKNNIEILYNSTITSLNGDNKLTSITINNQEEVSTSGLFIAIGQAPDNNIFKDLVELDEKGYIISDEYGHTKTKGIYVAGDTRKKMYRQLTTAVGDGTNACLTAIRESYEKRT